jgi:hypothetical protein
LFEAGIMIALRQLCAIFAIALVALVLMQPWAGNSDSVSGPLDNSLSHERSTNIPIGAAVALADLLIAAGLIATSAKPIITTANEIKRAARRHNPTNPLGAIDKLIGLAGLAALGCCFLAFTGERSGVGSFGDSSLCAMATLLVRPSIASFGFAFFGATTRAALLSKKLAPS